MMNFQNDSTSIADSNSEFESAIDVESFWKFIIPFQSRCMSDPTFSDIDFKNKMAWVWKPLSIIVKEVLHGIWAI